MLPDEFCLYTIRRSRKWYSLLLMILVDALAVAAALWLFRYLGRAFTSSYIQPGHLLGRAEFITVNLALGIVPILVTVALFQDFLFIFFTELSLTNRRIVGRVSGLLWTRKVDLPLSQVRAVEVEGRNLVIYRRDGSRLSFEGFGNYAMFAEAFQCQRLGLSLIEEDLFDSLPDGFTFENG